MAVIYSTAVKEDRMTATRDAVANGTLEIMAADNTVLAIFGLSASGGSVSGAVWTLAFDATSVSAESGAGAGQDRDPGADQGQRRHRANHGPDCRDVGQ